VSALNRWSWVFAVIGVALVAAGVVVSFTDNWSYEGPPAYLALAGLACLFAWSGLDRDRVSTTVRSRAFAYGSGAWILVLMVGAIAGGGYALVRRHDHTWDLSKNGTYSISDHTKTVLAGLKDDIQVIGFFANASQQQHDFDTLIRLYTEQTPHLKVQYVDPLRSPRLAEQYQISTDSGTIVLKRGDKERRLTDLKETPLTDALVVLASDTEHRICWSLGHGEPEPDDEFGEQGLGGFVSLLEGSNYQVMKTHIANEGIDRACEVLIIARPQTEPFPYEREAIAAYLAEGGRAVVMLEPFTVPELAASLARYGLTVGSDLVVDVDPKNTFMGVSDPSVVVLSDENVMPHEITKSLSAALVLPSACSVTPADPMPDGLVSTVLLKSSPQSWAETTPDQPGAQPDPNEKVGEIPVMVLVSVEDPAALKVAPPSSSPAPEVAAPGSAPPLDVEGDVGRAVPKDFTPKKGGKLVVLGDSELFDNSAIGLGNNKDLGLNTLAWLDDEHDQIGERPPAGDKLAITELGERMICLLSIVFVPGGAMGLAAITLLRRRFL
jgi:hypothetical protein